MMLESATQLRGKVTSLVLAAFLLSFATGCPTSSSPSAEDTDIESDSDVSDTSDSDPENDSDIPEDSDTDIDEDDEEDTGTLLSEDELLDETFRIDISNITVDFDLQSDSSKVECVAEVTFRMRPGQGMNLPVFHFEPLTNPSLGDMVTEVRLNDELLDHDDSSDIVLVSHGETVQDTVELQRELPEDTDHVLEISYELSLPSINSYPYFASTSSDLDGTGNEDFFPTLNTPHELARHELIFRIPKGGTDYGFIGSAAIEDQSTETTNIFILDTEREIASYTIYFFVYPNAYAYLRNEVINGVDIEIVMVMPGLDTMMKFIEMDVDNAVTILEGWLPQLEEDFGPFPIDTGLDISYSGIEGMMSFGPPHPMEYYGATTSNLGALEHEVFHMYYGCTTIFKTHRDSWLDEAIDVWYIDSATIGVLPIPNDYRSNWVGRFPPMANEFDELAYTDGPRIIERVAQEIGGRDEMIDFLRELHQNHSFEPMNTFDFLEHLEEYSGIDFEDQFVDWLYGGERLYE